MADLRPGEVCRRLLAALDVSEGRRRARKRDTTPDAIGLAIKRRLLEEAAREDPDPEAFEGWLLERCNAAGGGSGSGSGSVRAMARDILGEWRLARSSEAFRSWLDQAAVDPSLARSTK
jgi:hypothetical protein